MRKLSICEVAEAPPTVLLACAPMFDVVRHKLRILVRLGVLLVLLGIGTVPVECAAVYGPHSIFISAEAVEQVRDGIHQHHHEHDHADPAFAMTSKALPSAEADLPVSESPASDAVDLPETARTALDSLVAVAMFVADDVADPGDYAAVASIVAPPGDSMLPAPEPPPPQAGL